MKILVIALSGIGDALMFSPSISLIKKFFPNANIDLLCMFKGVKDIYETNPHLSKIIYFNFMKEGYLKSLFFLLKLRKKYDVTFNVYPSNRKEYNFISYLIGAKKRYAVEYLRMDFQNLGFLNNYRIIENDNFHNVKENLLLTKLFLENEGISFNIDEYVSNANLELFLTESDLKFRDNWYKDKEILDNEFVVGFHAGCSTLKNHIKRRWEPEKFASLGTKLIEKFSAKVILFGGPDEFDLNETINSLMDNKAFVAMTNSIRETSALMSRCNLFVTNDSALMHLASALKLNVIAIFGPTNTNYVHPWRTKHTIATLNLDCQPCFYYSPKPLTCHRYDVKFKCIKELSVDMVYNQIEKLLSSS